MLSADAVLVPTWATAPFRDRGIIWIQERFSRMLFYNTLTIHNFDRQKPG